MYLLYFQDVAKRTVTKTMEEVENGDEENGDFEEEDLLYQQASYL